MSEINDLSELSSGSAITEDQLHALIAKCDVWIHNILFGHGTHGAVPYKELGLAGHESDPVKLVAELRKVREMYVHALTHPEERGDFAILKSQYEV